MALAFDADLVHADPTILRLSLAGRDRGGDEHYFIMDRSEDSGEQALPDMGNVYIELDDQQWGGYGGIERVVLGRDRLTLQLGPRMTVQMGRNDEISITFHVGDLEFRRLRDVLEQIMRGYESQLECCD